MAESTVPYTTAGKLYAQFGQKNIRIWADVEGMEDDNNIDLTIASAIQDASRYFDDCVRDGVLPVPFVIDSIPRTVEGAVRMRTGWQLYVSRGLSLKDWDKTMMKMDEKFHTICDSLKNGSIRLDLLAASYQASMVPSATSDLTVLTNEDSLDVFE